MDANALKEIQEAETKAKQAIEQAREQAREVVGKAVQATSARWDEKIKKAEQEVEEHIERAKRQADTERKRLLLKAGKDAAALRKQAEANFEQATQLVMTRILEPDGH